MGFESRVFVCTYVRILQYVWGRGGGYARREWRHKSFSTITLYAMPCYTGFMVCVRRCVTNLWIEFTNSILKSQIINCTL